MLITKSAKFVYIFFSLYSFSTELTYHLVIMLLKINRQETGKFRNYIGSILIDKFIVDSFQVDLG